MVDTYQIATFCFQVVHLPYRYHHCDKDLFALIGCRERVIQFTTTANELEATMGSDNWLLGKCLLAIGVLSSSHLRFL